MLNADIKELLEARRFGVVTDRLYEDPGLVGALVSFLDEADSGTQTGILTILGRYGFDHPELVYPHVEAIMHVLARNDSLKSDVACAMGNLVFNSREKSAEVIPMLKELFHDEDSLLRQDAAAAMGNIGFKFPDLVEEDIPGLIAMLESDDEDEQETGAQALGKIGINSPEIIRETFPRLVSVLSHAKEASCGGIISAFGALGFHYPEMVREQIPKLVGYLHSTNPIAVKNAVMALGIIGMNNPDLIEPAVADLRKLTGDPDREIRLNAMVAISKSDDSG